MDRPIKERRKRSRIWTVPSEEFAQLVSASPSLAVILRALGYENAGTSYWALLARIEHDRLDISHIPRGVGVSGGPIARPLDEILVEGITLNRGKLKPRLVAAGLLPDLCAECGAPPIWQEKRLVFVLDHINGVNDDYRLENLRLLCPNCNSQTPTFCRGRRGAVCTDPGSSNGRTPPSGGGS